MAVGTIKELADRAGVSGTTVSLVFQGSTRISEKTRRKVLRIAREINYVPNMAARQLRRGKTRIKTIGLLVNDLRNPFYAMMVHSAEEAAGEQDYQILVADSQWQAEKELAELQNMIQFRVDGVAACLSETSPDAINLANAFPAPLVVMDTVPPTFDGPYVVNDIASAARLAAEHLVEIGCRRIVFFNGDESQQSFSSFQILSKEFKQVLKSNDLQFDQHSVFHAGLTIDAGRTAMTEIQKRVPDIDGLFCANTLCAIGAMETAARLGISVGSDLAVVGIDDLDLCTLDCISLTSIRQPYEKLTQIAIDVLIRGIEEEKPLDVQVSLKPELIARQSTNRKRK